LHHLVIDGCTFVSEQHSMEIVWWINLPEQTHFQRTNRRSNFNQQIFADYPKF
jgi:dephospho-CoA kinase